MSRALSPARAAGKVVQRNTEAEHGQTPPHTCGDRASSLWLWATCFMIAGLMAVLPAWFFDARTLDGVNIWNKPLKFWFSLALHFATLALLVRLIPNPAPQARDWAGGLVLALAVLSILAGIFEILYINLQAARGRASHFNFSTELEITMYSLMGVGAVMLVLASLIIGAIILLRAEPDNGYCLGAGLGLVTGSVLTLVVAGFMSSQGSHYYGVEGSDAGGLPLTGWSTTLPDLRPSHFVALHLMQIMPVIGIIADRLVHQHSRRIVKFATVAGTALCILLFLIALYGRAPLGFLNFALAMTTTGSIGIHNS